MAGKRKYQWVIDVVVAGVKKAGDSVYLSIPLDTDAATFQNRLCSVFNRQMPSPPEGTIWRRKIEYKGGFDYVKVWAEKLVGAVQEDDEYEYEYEYIEVEIEVDEEGNEVTS